jgi:hypothetical protein
VKETSQEEQMAALRASLAGVKKAPTKVDRLAHLETRMDDAATAIQDLTHALTEFVQHQSRPWWKKLLG